MPLPPFFKYCLPTWIFLLICLVAAPGVPAATGILTGTVTDMSSGAPIVSVMVSTINDQSTQTSPQGVYNLELTSGVYDITFQKTGYQGVTLTGVYIASGSQTVRHVQMTTPGPLNIITTALAAAEVDAAYNERVRISGGTYPYTFTLTRGRLPDGLTLQRDTGNIAGTPEVPGSFTFEVTVGDFLEARARREFTLVVTAPLVIVTTSPLPRGTRFAKYFKAFESTGGELPYTYQYVAGVMPDGVYVQPDGQVGFQERFASPLSRPWQLGGDVHPFISGERLRFGAINQRQVSSISIVEGGDGIIHFDYEVSSLSNGGFLRFYQNGVLQASWSGQQSGTHTQEVPAGLHTFTWRYEKTTFVIAGEDTAWLDNITITNNGGTPRPAGTWTFTVQVTDTVGRQAEDTFVLTVDEPLEITTARLPQGVQDQVYHHQLAVSGGVAPYTFGLHAGYLPPGLHLDSATGILTGTPRESAWQPVVFWVRDTHQRMVYQDFMLAIAEPLTILTTTLPPGVAHHPYSENIRSRGGLPPLSHSLSGQLPEGLILNADTGIIHGTPAAAGQVNLELTVTDSAWPTPQRSTRPLNLTIDTQLAILTAAVLPPQKRNTLLNPIVLSAAGGQAPYTWHLRAGYLPVGLTLENTAGRIIGTPEDWGDYRFTVTVQDAANLTADKEFFLQVADTLTIVTETLPAGGRERPYSATLRPRGGIPPYTWRLVTGTLPPGLEINTATGTLHGTPRQRMASTLTFEVKDSAIPFQTAEKTFTLDITDALYIVTTALPPARQHEAYATDIVVDLGVPPYRFQMTGGDLPSGLVLTSTLNGAHLSGTPTQAGTWPVTLRVQDQDTPAQSATATFNLTVYAPLRVTPAALKSAVRGVPYADRILASGGVPPHTVTLLSGELPLGLRLHSGTGVLSGSTHLPTGQSTNFVVEVADAGNPAARLTQAYAIYVIDALRITTASLLEGRQFRDYAALLTADGGIRPYTWSLAAGTLPQGLTLNGTTGQLAGSPATAGTFSLTVAVQDSAAVPNRATQTWDLLITPATPGHRITGRITDLPGVTLHLSGAATATTTTDAQGNYGFHHLDAGTYRLTPVKRGYRFLPAYHSVTIQHQDVTGVHFDFQRQNTFGLGGILWLLLGDE